MDDNSKQQVFDRINQANQILIALPVNPSGDAVGAGLALFDFLQKLDKEPEIVSAKKDLSKFSFLPHSKAIKNQLVAAQSFVVMVDTKQAPLDELSYEIKDSRAEIYLKPKSGKYTEDDVSFGSARFPYDLIVTVDTPSLEHLGPVYESNTDLFFETPVINLDHHPSNEHYGEINLVDLTATSSSEIVTTMIEDFEESLIDENIATNLLLGIIVETNSFQHVKTTPQAFLKASRLVSKGARQQEIVRALYKTKEISLLKLWGRALARLREVPELKLTYSLLSKSDMEKCEADREELFGVISELASILSESKILLLLAEVEEGEIQGLFHLHPGIKAQVLASSLEGEMINGSYGTFELTGKELLVAEKEVLAKLQKVKDQLAV